MQAVHFRVGSCFVGSGRGYIYILYTKTQRCLYVGQTSDQGGVIGRLSSHIAPNGTFRSRLYDRGIDLDDIDDLEIFAYHLPDDLRYTVTDRAHREGVEHLVQKRLHTIRGDLTPPMKIVSHVVYNSSAELVYIRHTADQVIEAFLVAYQR